MNFMTTDKKRLDARPAAEKGRVIQLIHSPDPGGVLALANSIADGLERHDLPVETLFLTPAPGVPLAAKLKGALRMVRRLIADRDAAVIAYQAGPSIVAALANLVARRERLLIHQTTIPSATKAPVRWLGALLGTVGLYPVNIVNTVFTKGEFDDYPAAYRRRLLLIEHGVDRPAIRAARADTLRRYGIPAEGRILLNTARLVEEKTQDTIIRALVDLPDCRLVVAGTGDRRARYERLAASLGVADRVHLLGALPYGEVVELYGIADQFVFPSLHETFGISAVEAALLALPTIVADIKVLREVLTIDGETPVRFVAPRDVAGWVAAIRTFVDSPPPEAERRRFADRLARRYSTERMIDAYVALLSAPGR
ncbi:glycosyltransferase family 4 protein [Sphingomonas sp. LHG3406-1]|uniref:glycosyltransferase family 4 protein n=1 Tax=Sphingomonas sp. LHG3406-1 TaxID=2804617 RepID=UPI0026185050|nr:glycosyltransferase family 4 protein [Sphingomonas sp. LHG3406-1]